MTQQRYEIVGPWRETWCVRVHGATIRILVCDLRDTRGGYVYRDGTHQVKVTKSNRLPATGQPRTRTFKGEQAWCKAESYAEDARNWYQRQYIDGRLTHQPLTLTDQ